MVFVGGTHMMRNGALEKLSDADLAFSPGGDSPTLGELFNTLGAMQASYIQSLRTQKHDWSYTSRRENMNTSIENLTTLFVQLDRRMEHVIGGLSDDDMSQMVDRTNGVQRIVERQIQIYLEAMLIFLGKLVIYFQSMQKPLPDSIQHYIV